MGIFSKKLEELTREDLEELITNKERESIHLDYKQAINSSDKGKHDLVKHIVGMANTEGGFIIFGISEDNENGIPEELIGIESSVGNQKVDEWVENVINPHASPRIMINIKIIILDTKIAMILHIPQSSRRPHMSTYDKDFRIYRRYNTQTLAASEGEVREMYLSSNKREKKLEDLIQLKNITNVDSENFALTTKSRTMIQNIQGIEPKNIPMIVISSCPRFLDEKIDIADENIQEWLKRNQNVTIDEHNIQIVPPRDPILDSTSLTYVIKNAQQENTLEYMEIQRNCFVEYGLGIRLIHHNQDKFVLNLGKLAISLWGFILFIKSFYERIGYYDEFSIFLSIRNVNKLVLSGLLGISERGMPYSTLYDEPFSYLNITPINGAMTYDVAYHTSPNEINFNYNDSFLINEINATEIFNIVKKFSTRVSNSFGLTKPYCYNDDGTFVKRHLENYNTLI